MYITYRDNGGYVLEKVDEYGIGCDGKDLFFNDKKIPVADVVQIQESEE